MSIVIFGDLASSQPPYSIKSLRHALHQPPDQLLVPVQLDPLFHNDGVESLCCWHPLGSLTQQSAILLACWSGSSLLAKSKELCNSFLGFPGAVDPGSVALPRLFMVRFQILYSVAMVGLGSRLDHCCLAYSNPCCNSPGSTKPETSSSRTTS